MPMRFALAFAIAGVAISPAYAQTPLERVLTPEEKAEKESRKACKIAICGILRSKEAEGPDVSCDIVKTWREEDISKMVSGSKIDWPYGRAICRTKLAIGRVPLAKAMAEARYEMDVPKHTIRCELDRKSDAKPYVVEVEIAPKVTFENGKAVAAQLNWGDLEAPTFAKGVLWPGSALDNSVNILGGEIVRMTNEFSGRKCDEVKDQLPGAAPSPAP